MTFSPSFPLTGVASSITELGRIDPELAKAARVRMKEAANPMVAAARGFIPTGSPLSGMSRGKRLGWSTARVRAGITAKVSTKPARNGYIPLLSVIQKNPAGAMWDMAGRRSNGNTAAGRNMVKVMQERNGGASRSMWPAAEATTLTVEENLRIAIVDLETTLSVRLGGSR